MSRTSIDEARALAGKWKAQHEDHIREGEIQARFSGVPANDLLEMWEQRTNERGKRLTKFEAEALAYALTEAFGCVPGAVKGEKAENKTLPPDDTMLPMSEVIRLTGVSESSIKRLIEKGLFRSLKETWRLGLACIPRPSLSGPDRANSHGPSA